jgi:hypothetical protein
MQENQQIVFLSDGGGKHVRAPVLDTALGNSGTVAGVKMTPKRSKIIPRLLLRAGIKTSTRCRGPIRHTAPGRL